jgi:hypothetical protein
MSNKTLEQRQKRRAVAVSDAEKRIQELYTATLNKTKGETK